MPCLASQWKPPSESGPAALDKMGERAGGGGASPLGPPTLRALCTSFIAAAADRGLVGSLGDLPSELIPPLVARVSNAAALATIADETAAQCGRCLAAELDAAWARAFAADFGRSGGIEASGPSSSSSVPLWRRRYEAEAARRAAALATAAARVRARFEESAAAAKARSVVVLDRPPPQRRGRGRGIGRGGRPEPYIPPPARLLAKLGHLPDARAVVARAVGGGNRRPPAIFMRPRAQATRPPPAPPRPPAGLTPNEHAFV